MNIGIVGYGKMGHMVEQKALERGHSVLWRANSYEELKSALVGTQKPDVVIEFSKPAVAVENLQLCLSHGLKVVCGTTGWYARLPEVLALQAQHSGSALFYAPNFSIGVRIASLLTRQLAHYQRQFSQYGVAIEETHHTAKLDAPSGTAILLAKPFLDEGSCYSKWVLMPEAPEGSLPITARRVGSVPGTHTVRLESAVDTIELTHTAKGREGFAEGALLAAEYVASRSGVFTMDDLLPDSMGGNGG